MRFGDIVIAIMVVSIVIMIIIPLPTGIMDFLLTLNITLSLVILLISMYINEPLQFSIFPSLLLLTTLLRLSLNISTTRLILRDADAGEVIRAFGDFVVGGDAVVGFIIFLIIVIIQFIVITKGAERIAEVAARFTLDAMPGKQMAIDADLNAGLINEAEARERRKNIEREADFYGAMDGASKFVKGDAIAGIIITLINISGGLIIGIVQRGMEFQSALSTYTLLTVGDGLVSQIPALLISTSAGIIVTKTASDSNLGSEITRQLFAQPKVMFLSAGLLAALGLVPALPQRPLYMLAVLLFISGNSIRRAAKGTQEGMGEETQPTYIEEMRKPENVMGLLQVDPIEVEFGYAIIPLADVNQGGDLLDRVVMIRRQIALELGMVVPIIRLRDNIQLNPSQYRIKIKGIEVSEGELVMDGFLAMDPGTADGEIEGTDTTEPAFGLPAKWIKEGERDKAELLGYTVVDPPTVISTHLTETIKSHIHELLGRQEVKKLVDNLKENYPTLVEELLPKQMTFGEVQKVLANLLKEGVSIRDLVTIFETLADYAPVTRDPDMLTEYVRQSLSRTISKKFVAGKKAKVVTLDRDLEERIMNSVQQTEQGSYLTLDPAVTKDIMNSLSKQMELFNQLGEQPIILTSPVVRLYFKKLTEQFAPGLVVLSYNELDPGIEIQSMGMVSA
ncbi:MAG: flagellar biosynthesis protein FlhA [Bacillota bacterium]|nr:flagellar biosynthesis protein FlhA [Bacillota bacterium]MDD3850117.1 flagellar biosynthesis protein FlhA [Bacillota bacterium]MDD4706840.1 flagellar biosynthesis protein FlhA [Bacillota bacterium]